MRALLLAAPGAGKGTVGTRLAAHYQARHISSGDLLRAEAAAGTALGRQVQGWLDSGDLVPDALLDALLLPVIESAAASGGYILDGFPRTLAQARTAHAVAAGLGIAVQGVLHLTAPSELLADRMRGRGRSDDTEATVRHRLEVYRRQTEPLVEYYRSRGVLHDVDAAGSVAQVTAAAVAALDQAAAAG